MTDSLLAFYDELFFHSLHTRDKKHAVILDRVFLATVFSCLLSHLSQCFCFKGYNPRVSKEHRKAE